VTALRLLDDFAGLEGLPYHHPRRVELRNGPPITGLPYLDPYRLAVRAERRLREAELYKDRGADQVWAIVMRARKERLVRDWWAWARARG
jgi:hypothetical protein